MAKVALLIGFVYRDRRFLPGSLVDLYRVYTFLTNTGYDTIHLICDLHDDPSTNYHEPITEGYVDANLLSFINDMKKRKTHHFATCGEDIDKVIKQTKILSHDKVIIYITGHGEKNGLVCPLGFYPWLSLRDTIFASLNRETQAVIIIDTCQAPNFNFPYLVSRQKDKLSFVTTRFFPSSDVVLIATQGDVAASTASGSLVTRGLIACFENKDDVFFDLRKKVEETLTTTETLRNLNLCLEIYASHPSLHKLWSWVISHEEKRSVDIFKDGLFIRLE